MSQQQDANKGLMRQIKGKPLYGIKMPALVQDVRKPSASLNT